MPQIGHSCHVGHSCHDTPTTTAQSSLEVQEVWVEVISGIGVRLTQVPTLGEGSKPCSLKGKEPVGAIGETRTPRPRRPRSVKELYQTSADEGHAGYYALFMTDQPTSDPDVPLETRWSSLTQGTKVWEQLKEIWARCRTLEDELLKMTGTLERLRVKLPMEAITEYKKSTSFEMGLV
ncbi:hypothetical protein B296_00007103 [Ensete ventricosum]|uniref:Uncharacterized protein n=1 Tax=Ensete ventricosum TaxID=4639 RepID=A0A427AR49_ENSVE|nr:hypothetical protein B296_00007103 [Ensete ventricosum]